MSQVTPSGQPGRASLAPWLSCPQLIGLWALTVTAATRASSGATLPSHGPLSILVLADAVNPNRLTPEELAEPADFAPASSAEVAGRF